MLHGQGELPPDGEIVFETASGRLPAKRRPDGCIELSFAAEPPEPLDAPPPQLAEGLGTVPIWVGRNRLDHVVRVANAAASRASPARMRRSMSSTITRPLSTSRPSEMMIAAMETCCSSTPNGPINAKAKLTAKGTIEAMTTAARGPMKTSMTVETTAKVCAMLMSAPLTLPDTISGWKVENVSLAFSLAPHATRVRTRMAMAPNPDAPPQRFFLHGDELDEAQRKKVRRTTTRVFAVRDLDRPRLRGTATGPSGAIDHNIYTDRRYAYASNYTAGLRVLGLGRVAEGRLVEKAFFDVYPQHDDAAFEGTWSNYADFEQRRLVAVSSIDRGLFLVRPRLEGQA